MNFTLTVALSALGLFFGMLVASAAGRRIGLARLARGVALATGVEAAEAAVFGLLALLIAFTFSGAAGRFDDRRHLVAEEANAIGTAYLRLDLLPPDTQPELKSLVRRYLDVRAAAYRDVEDVRTTQRELQAGEALQGRIWTRAVAATRRPDTSQAATLLVVASLNEMFDITDTRAAATRHHPPHAIFLLLGGLCLIAAFLVGYEVSRNKEHSPLHIVLFAAMLSLTVYVIMEIEYPRLGLIRVDDADQSLMELRARMQ